MRVLWPYLLFVAFVPQVLAASGPNPRTDVESRGTVRPSPDADPAYLRRTTGAFAAWSGDRNKRMMSYDYRMALRFAECVGRFNRDAADTILLAPIGGRDDMRGLARLIEVNSGCVVQRSLVHPLLLRAALAETMLKRGPITLGTGRPAIGRVGVPDVVDGYPLASISQCQLASAPRRVAALLATQPGEAGEQSAANALFSATASCGAARLGRLTPTVARLALIDAASRDDLVIGVKR